MPASSRCFACGNHAFSQLCKPVGVRISETGLQAAARFSSVRLQQSQAQQFGPNGDVCEATQLQADCEVAEANFPTQATTTNPSVSTLLLHFLPALNTTQPPRLFPQSLYRKRGPSSCKTWKQPTMTCRPSATTLTSSRKVAGGVQPPRPLRAGPNSCVLLVSRWLVPALQDADL